MNDENNNNTTQHTFSQGVMLTGGGNNTTGTLADLPSGQLTMITWNTIPPLSEISAFSCDNTYDGTYFPETHLSGATEDPSE